MEMFNIGVIGLGMGSTVLEINRIPGSRLQVTGICDKDLQKARQCQKRYGIETITDDYTKLTENKDIHIIAVFSPDHLHAEHCKAALQQSKHVICTKPMVTDLEHAKQIAQLTRQKKVKFLVGQTMRYEPQFTTIKTMYDQQDLGDIIMAEAHYVHDMRPVYQMTPWRLEVPQDFMYGGVCHPVDVLRWFLGDVQEVFAYANRGGLEPKYPKQANFMLNLKFKNGVVARILGIYDIVHPPMPMMGVSIFGTKGSAIGSFSDKLGGEVKTVLDKFEIKAESKIAYPPETEGAYGHGATVIRYLKHFEQCLIEDKTPVPDVREGAKSIAVCSAAWESIRTGKPVEVFNDF